MAFDIDINMDEEFIDDFADSIERAEGIMGFTAPHAVHIEFPTEYNNPSGNGQFVKDLEKWVKRNLNVNDPTSVAYAIRNEIFKNGQEGDFFVTDTLNDVEQGIAEEVADKYEGIEDPKAPEKIVGDILDKSRVRAQDKIKNADRVDTGELLNSDTVVIGVDPESDEITVSENLGNIL